VEIAPHLSFPPFRLDPAGEQFWRDREEIKLRRKTFEVLRYLANHPGELVTKAILLDAVWGEVAVSDSMPAICVSELRKALGDDVRAPRFIVTVPGRGYRFIAPVTTVAESIAPAKPRALPVADPLIVGRRQELAQIRQWLMSVIRGTRNVIFVWGEPGIGKTTFVREFLASIAGKNPTRIAQGQCIEQYGAGEPYLPVIEALTRLCQEPGGADVLVMLRQYAPSWLAQMPSLSAETERERLRDATRGVTQQRMLSEMTSALEALAAETPMVLLLEDLHWSDPSTLELISAIARRPAAAKLLIIGTYRPAEILAPGHLLRRVKGELDLHHQCDELRLRFLSASDIGDYLAARFSDGSRAGRFTDVAAAIFARTDGNPLFVVELVDFLVAQGILEPTGRAFVGDARQLEAGSLNMPGNILQMVERNLEQLGVEQQRVLEASSVAGAEFSAAAVAAALDCSSNDVEGCCAQLSRGELFVRANGIAQWPDGTVAASFRFHHALYRDVLYERVPAGHRIEMHRRIAMREESAYGARVAERAAELAHHYLCANDKVNAVRYLQMVAERATARGASVEAQGHYTTALNLLAELPENVERDRCEFRLQVGLGTALAGAKSWAHPEPRKALLRAQELAEKIGDTQQLATVLYGLAASAQTRGQVTMSEELAERMLRLTNADSPRWLLCAAHYMVGQASQSGAKLEQAYEHLELANTYFDEESRELSALGAIVPPAVAAHVNLQLGFPDRARRLIVDALEKTERHGNSFQIGYTFHWACLMNLALNEWEPLLELVQKLERHAKANPYFVGAADFCAGVALLTQGHIEEGAARTRRARVFWEQVGYRILLPLELGVEALFCAPEDALGTIAHALEETVEMPHQRPVVLMFRGDVLLRLGVEAREIEAAYREAMQCARELHCKLDELQITKRFARCLIGQGRAAEARDTLAALYGSFTEGFETAPLREARALLAELAVKSYPSPYPH
jgi:DNA-binding winged helix-turn-helix (wHTH) protein/tetratricopeptide (TPR) repeat protein